MNESVPNEVYSSCRPGPGKTAPGDCPERCQCDSEYKKDPYQFIKKLKASNPVYSFRVRGDVRALLSIDDDVLIIHVLEIDYRKQAYRDFQKAKITK